jgi:abequosyltransferase
MPHTKEHTSRPRLSICITTFNRAPYIGATLESILTQVTPDCEVIVLDGGSTDGTELVLSEYTRRFDSLKYVRQDVNNGFDRDCDRVVELSRGEFFWLMADDDLLKPGAVAKVLQMLREDLSLIIVNMEARDFRMEAVLQRSWLSFDSDRTYLPNEVDRLFVDAGHLLRYVGGIILKREIWFARDRQRHFGTWFNFVGVIFQEALPDSILLVAEPLISYRMGNSHTFWPKMPEIMFSYWPGLVRELVRSESARRKVYGAEPWMNPPELLWLRARGAYSLADYKKWIRPRLPSAGRKILPALVAMLPGAIANSLLMSYCLSRRRAYLGVWHPELVRHALRESPYHFRNWRAARAHRS